MAWLVASLVACSHAPEDRGAGDATTVAVDRAPTAMAATPWQDAVPRPDPLLPAGNTSPYEVNGQTYTVMASSEHYSERGIASWYGMKFHGRQTSNGEIFDVFGATAAHRSLPIPSYVRVTNLSNQQTVVLRVNDRGPFHSERIIDLSYGAAAQLGFADQGTASVLVEAVTLSGVDDRRGSPDATYRYLQLGAYQSLPTAQQVVADVTAEQDYTATITPVDVGAQRLYRVRLGPFADPAVLEQARQNLVAEGYAAPQPLP
ncbi:MAG: septal ring lytic transglycosylase RlpA family protein [Luminiphilus sp.]